MESARGCHDRCISPLIDWFIDWLNDWMKFITTPIFSWRAALKMGNDAEGNDAAGLRRVTALRCACHCVALCVPRYTIRRGTWLGNTVTFGTSTASTFTRCRPSISKMKLKSCWHSIFGMPRCPLSEAMRCQLTPQHPWYGASSWNLTKDPQSAEWEDEQFGWRQRTKRNFDAFTTTQCWRTWCCNERFRKRRFREQTIWSLRRDDGRIERLLYDYRRMKLW